MNETIKTMINRRSCKAYTGQPVSEEIVNEIISAGLHAPTAFNTQNPIIIKVTDQETITQLSKLNASYDHLKRPDPFYGAPCVLIVLADRAYPDCVYDGVLVAGNILNAAASLSVGACWINRAKLMYDSPEGKDFLKKVGIEGDYEGITNIIIGEAKVMPEGPLPRKENRVFEVK